MTAPSIYRAKVVIPFANGNCWVVIPQLFGDTQVLVSRFASVTLPLELPMGWVMFEGGDEARPVWMGADTPLTPP